MNKPTIILTFCLVASGLRAQIDPGMAKIRMLLEKVESGMQDVDKLLLQSTNKGGAAAAKEAAGAAAKRLEELMKQLQGSQDSVSKDMQKLIEEIERMRQQQQQQQQDQSGDPQRSNRPKPDDQQQDQQRQQQQDQVQTPDMVKQNDPEQQKQRQQQQQQQQKGQPNGPEKDKDRGQQLPGEKPPPGEEERTPHVQDNQRWGVLPKYLEFMHSRGGMPEVPEKYRRYYEAFLKSDLAKPEGKAPASERR